MLKKYNLVKEFEYCTGFGIGYSGNYIGRMFRERVLRPIFESDDTIEIDFTGILLLPSESFIDKAFAKIGEEYGGFDNFNKKVNLIYPKKKDRMLRKIKYYIELRENYTLCLIKEK